jgi:hypothetical protein
MRTATYELVLYSLDPAVAPRGTYGGISTYSTFVPVGPGGTVLDLTQFSALITMRASVRGRGDGNWLHFSAKVPILPGFTPKQAARRPAACCWLI